MTQKTIKFFKNETYSKPPKKNYSTDKTDVYHIDDIWSLYILDLKDYGSENNKAYRYDLVIKDNFKKNRWTVPPKIKNAEILKDSFKNILINSKRKPDFLEGDRDGGF